MTIRHLSLDVGLSVIVGMAACHWGRAACHGRGGQPVIGGTVLMQWHGMVTCLWQLQMLGMPWLARVRPLLLPVGKRGYCAHYVAGCTAQQDRG